MFVVGVGASCVDSYESVPHEGIWVGKVVKHASGVGEIGLSQRGVVLKNIGVEKDSSVNLLELRHSDSGGFVQQVDKVLALVVGAGGCG